MKKIVLMILMGVMLVSASACGKEEPVQKSGVQESGEKEDTEKKETKDGFLLGVYEGSQEYGTVSMGTFYEGEQKDFCKIKMPMEYLFSTAYTEDGRRESNNVDISAVSLETAFSLGLEEQEMANSSVLLMSVGGTTMNFYIIPDTNRTIEDDKEYAGEYQEITEGDHYAMYFKDQSEYATSD